MKKFSIVFILLMVLFLSSCTGHHHELVYVDVLSATCTEGGIVPFYMCKTCKKTFEDKDGKIELNEAKRTEPLGHLYENNLSCDQRYHYNKCIRCDSRINVEEHTFDNDTDYIIPIECNICHKRVRRYKNEDILDKLIYDFKVDDRTSYLQIIDEMNLLLENDDIEDENHSDNFNTLISDFSKLYEYRSKIQKNRTTAELNFYVSMEDLWKDRMIEIINYNDEIIISINSLIEKMLKSDYLDLYKEYYNYTDEYIKILIDYYSGYVDPNLLDMNNRITELEYNLYYNIDNYSASELNTMFNELRDLRNSVAKLFNYDTYYEYAYEINYERCYSTDIIKDFRKYIKDYIVPIKKSLDLKYDKIKNNITQDQSKIIDTINNSRSLDNELLLNLAASYFKLLKDEDNNIDFFDSINTAFKDGRVVEGKAERSFSSTISLVGGRIMFFGGTDYYSNLKSLIHESGHFMFSGTSIINDFDYLELHSQSNEALFLSYLDSVYNDDMENVFKVILLNDFNEHFRVIFSSVISDEIEEAFYKNYYHLDGVDTSKFEDGIEYSEIDDLLDVICEYYGMSSLRYNDYFEAYFSNRSCYEISYAVSLIPCINLFVESEIYGFESAMNKYFKTYLYQFDNEFINSNPNLSYLDVLQYSGYKNPFDEETYKIIKNYYMGIAS